MRPYANTVFTASQLDLFETIRRCVTSVPHTHGHDDPSCHELARAVGRQFGLPVVDGHYLLGFEHSWLDVDGHVLDVYPIGHAGYSISPILVDRHIAKFTALHSGSMVYSLYDGSRKPRGVDRVRVDIVREIQQRIMSVQRESR